MLGSLPWTTRNGGALLLRAAARSQQQRRRQLLAVNLATRRHRSDAAASGSSSSHHGLGLERDVQDGFGVNQRGLGHNNYLGKILNARVYDIARETPLSAAPMLSTQLQNTVLLKREDMQPVFSFKIRGAYNKMAQLRPEQQRAGVVACSAGNHAQGVALSARHLGIDAIIVMPLATPRIKVDAVRKHGGNVVLHGNNYDEAQATS